MVQQNFLVTKNGKIWLLKVKYDFSLKLADRECSNFQISFASCCQLFFTFRDSADERYLLSLSFRSFGRTLHTRIEHSNGKFSFYADGDSQVSKEVLHTLHSIFCHNQA